MKDLTRKDFEVIDRGERRVINEFRSEGGRPSAWRFSST